jgi:hypothetical protein
MVLKSSFFLSMSVLQNKYIYCILVYTFCIFYSWLMSTVFFIIRYTSELYLIYYKIHDEVHIWPPFQWKICFTKTGVSLTFIERGDISSFKIIILCYQSTLFKKVFLYIFLWYGSILISITTDYHILF